MKTGLLWLMCAAASAEAWLEAGDALLRHDLQLLADTGVIRLPLTAWPLPAVDVTEALAQVSSREELSSAQQAALRRLERRMNTLRREPFRAEMRVSSALEPTRLRTFDDSPREEGEITARVGIAGNDVSAALKVTAVASPADGQRWRLDGSYLTTRLGNWLLSAGAPERWWGPGWDGSLILSTNARPIPGLSLERESSRPFETRWLSWLGPWRLTTFLGRMESERQDRDHPLLFGMRVVAQPLRGLEIGLERTIQFCGEGRPCSPHAFWDAFSGNDNAGENVDPQDEPGNQLAGWSLRWVSPVGNAPYAFYAQHTGESIDNELPIRPRRSLDLLGLESWGEWGEGGSWRVHIESAGTACGEFDDAPAPFFDCAYNNGIFFVEGYRYRGRVLGHALDGDGKLYTLGLRVASASSWSGSVRLRRGELNRGGTVPDLRHTVAAEPTKLWNLESTFRMVFDRFEIDLGAGFDRTSVDRSGDSDQSLRAFVQWRYSL